MFVNASGPCPCGRTNSALSQCCGPYLVGQQVAPTAEALMRSRYTAFTMGNIDYLTRTHHPSTRTMGDRAALEQSIQNTTWLGLTILDRQQGQPDDTTGIVEFVARYESGTIGQIHERSRFRQQKGRWFYVDGDLLPPVDPKRNDPCWCGSGKKFKQCHGQ